VKCFHNQNSAIMGKSLKRNRDLSNGATAESPSAPSKRQRQSKADDIELARLYGELAAEDETVRLEAVKGFLSKFSPGGEAGSQAIEKALNRLIKGLCSQRKAARLGFSITLAELLRQLVGQDHPGFKELNFGVSGVLNLLESKTEPAKNVSGQVRNHKPISNLKSNQNRNEGIT